MPSSALAVSLQVGNGKPGKLLFSVKIFKSLNILNHVEGHGYPWAILSSGPVICRCFLGADGKLLNLDEMQAG